MLPRASWLVCLVCLGCQLAPPAETQPTASTAPPRNELSQAAAALSAGDDEQACRYLDRFVEMQPEHRNSRLLLAELQLQRGRHSEAREHFELAIAACQANHQDQVRHLLHCHGRLLTIAEALEDDYEAALQKGIGLTLLAQARARLGDPQGELPVEALLFRAAGCLTAAHALRPDQARPCWYLHEVWRQLGQTQLAERWLQDAQAAAAFSALTPVEQRRLALATDASEQKPKR